MAEPHTLNQSTVFVTATDTGAGKTAITALLLRRLLAAGIDACALKPVASGLDAHGANEDIAALLAAAGRPATDSGIGADAVNLYRFALPAAPSLAAAAEGQAIDPARLAAWCRERSRGRQICLIEGVGGLMVPLTAEFLVRDWLAAMPEAAILLVVPARLGAINHALLTLAELARIGRVPRWLVISDVAGGEKRMTEQIAQALIPHLAPATRMLMLDHLDAADMDGPTAQDFAAAWLDSLAAGGPGAEVCA
jgi:dethiobiotin synthetase